MNTQTGRIYEGDADIEAARQRGEPIVEISAKVAALMERAQIELDKEERRRQWRAKWFDSRTAE